MGAPGVVERVRASLDSPDAHRWFRAPGRVNLIGDHTDYNDGFVLPMAIDLDTVVAVVPNGGGRVRLRSLDAREEEGQVVDVAADGTDEPGAVRPAWGRYVAGVARALAERGRAPVGLDGVLASSVPRGSGLSSSAALEVACALALADVGDLTLEPLELAAACQAAEHRATGVPSGLMDQLSSVFGRDGHALLIDCRTFVVEPVPFPVEVAVIVVHSGVSRTLGDTAYAQRRAACERAAAALGLPALRDATLEQVVHDPIARHVVTENARVLEAVAALRAADYRALGALLDASHASLRDDFRVSTPELDTLVAGLREAGALGARLTGAGFGGCVVALADRALAEVVLRAATSAYCRASQREATPYVVRASAAAGPLALP